jgi:glutathione synthase/RimK-type ligase-like ATP-grasp enzyme
MTMVLVCGIPTEPPIELLVDELKLTGTPYLLWNPRKFAGTRISIELDPGGGIVGSLFYEETSYDLRVFSSIYSRMTDWTTLPEIEQDPHNEALRAKCERIHFLMQLFIDNTEALVINPSDAMASNGSKPYQLFLARDNGLKIPDTLVTTNPAAARDFYGNHRQHVIYKSISGVRSVVQKMKAEELDKLDKLHYCPTQFQEFVTGNNLRVHVIDRRVIATEILADAIDYRYAAWENKQSAVLKHTELPATDQNSCIRFSRAIGLYFSGLDFRKREDGSLVCLEANPMPGYSYYEESTSQPIAYTLACELEIQDSNYRGLTSSKEITIGIPS